MYWNKWMESLDDEDIYRHIRRDFEDDNRRGDGRRDGDNYHHMDKESQLRKLAKIYEKIEDYFESQGLDPRSYMEQNRRTGNR
jgi:hypothetical protein